MRVLFFSRGFTPHDRRFLEKMAGWRHEIAFLMLEENPGFNPGSVLPGGVAFAGSLGAPLDVASPEEWTGFLPRLGEVCLSWKPDLVHAGPVQSCGFLAARGGHRPLLLMSWGSDILLDADRDDRWREATRETLLGSDWLLCDCAAVAGKVREFTPYDASRIVMFPWGVDLRRFRPAAGPSPLREELGWEDCSVILSTRMWERVYGIDTLVEAFGLASTRDPGLRLILLGNGALRPRVLRFIREQGLAERVLLPGTVEESRMPGFFHAADLYLSCSLSDGSSVSLLQAMACGIPVAVTDIPGNREWVTGGENGLLFRAGDPAACAGAIGHAFRLGEDDRRVMAGRNRAIAEARADWDKNILLLLATYDRIGEIHGT